MTQLYHRDHYKMLVKGLTTFDLIISRTEGLIAEGFRVVSLSDLTDQGKVTMSPMILKVSTRPEYKSNKKKMFRKIFIR